MTSAPCNQKVCPRVCINRRVEGYDSGEGQLEPDSQFQSECDVAFRSGTNKDLESLQLAYEGT